MALVMLIVCVGVAAGVLAVAVLLRKRTSDRAKLMLTIVLTASVLGAALSGPYVYDGESIVREGAGPMGQVLPRFEQQVEEGGTSQPGYHVWVLGDSTHVSRGATSVTMLQALRDAASTAAGEIVEVSGTHWPGFDGYEYYFLLNRLVENPPDLIILPLNLRSFGESWGDDGANWFPVTERYCRWTEFGTATQLSTDGRHISWTGVLLRKIDYALLSSWGEGYLNGLKLRMSNLAVKLWQAGDTADRSDEVTTQSDIEQRLRHFVQTGNYMYAQSLREDHHLIDVFRAINRLAGEHGIGVMYYTVQTPDPRAKQEFSFMTLHWELEKDPNVRFVEMLDTIHPQDFQRFEHFYESGMRRVAARLMDEIIAARDDAAWRAAVTRGAEPAL